MRITSRTVLALTGVVTAVWLSSPWPRAASAARAGTTAADLFQTADRCVSCHTGLVTPTGEDVSFATHWRASMMANSARDPYWQAGVRREVIEHPQARVAIEDECSACHMPMTRYAAKASGHEGAVFAFLAAATPADPERLLAADGVSCTVCHQIGPERLGERASFTGGFHVDTAMPAGARRIFGPFDIDPGRSRIMQSASGFVPARAPHPGGSEMCATCHTLITQALGKAGEVVGELPEQVPYLEWQHSGYRDTTSCQACHMPVVDQSTPITGVWGEPRAGVSRHTFLGGNVLMMRMLNRHRADLGVEASPQELDRAAGRTTAHLESEAARVSILRAEAGDERLVVEIAVENRAGHKLPTAYPSRRAWLHVTVRDGHDAIVFESGRPGAGGRIEGNDNDEDEARFEQHHDEIVEGGQVQIYEAVMADSEGRVTTGLLSAVRYVKDNRLLPRGFDKGSAPGEVAVHGHAAGDADFSTGGDRVRYSLALPRTAAPQRVEAELLYQSIGYRWAENLRRFDTAETRRFLSYYEPMAASSAVALARATAVVSQGPTLTAARGGH
jgi:hypothetical protein